MFSHNVSDNVSHTMHLSALASAVIVAVLAAPSLALALLDLLHEREEDSVLIQ